jgi:hypothetical protein
MVTSTAAVVAPQQRCHMSERSSKEFQSSSVMGQSTLGTKTIRSNSELYQTRIKSYLRKDGRRSSLPMSDPGEISLPRVVVPSYVTAESLQELNPNRRAPIIVSRHEIESFRQLLQEFHEREVIRITTVMQSRAAKFFPGSGSA